MSPHNIGTLGGKDLDWQTLTCSLKKEKAIYREFKLTPLVPRVTCSEPVLRTEAGPGPGEAVSLVSRHEARLACSVRPPGLARLDWWRSVTSVPSPAPPRPSLQLLPSADMSPSHLLPTLGTQQNGSASVQFLHTSP